MTKTIAVTYTGKDAPFIDRIYRSGLTFTNGQSRDVPSPLAERFLRHTDVFKISATQTPLVNEPENSSDDTSAILEAQKSIEDAKRKLDEARFTLMDQLDSMDKKALIDFADIHYKQKLHANMSDANIRERVKGFVDQYGMP